MESALYGVYTLVLYQKSQSFASLTCSILIRHNSCVNTVRAHLTWSILNELIASRISRKREVLWEHERQSSVSRTFWAFPNFRQYFYNSNHTAQKKCFLFLLNQHRPRKGKETHSFTSISNIYRITEILRALWLAHLKVQKGRFF